MAGVLEAKVAVITGAHSGIGRQAALHFAREGASVANIAEQGGLETVDLVRKQGRAHLCEGGRRSR